MNKISELELYKESMKFSAAHFTVFSATERESLHGHNYQVYLKITTLVGDLGLNFDYRLYKNKMLKICKKLNQKTILPEFCPHLKLEKKNNQVNVDFNGEKMSFVANDVFILPIRNTTLEEISSWFIEELILDIDQIKKNKINALKIKVFSAAGQNGSSVWRLS